jgi:hypothetical protein
MSNLGYIIAAYAITIGALAIYGLLLWNWLHLAERQLTTLTTTEEERDGQQ